MDDVIIVYVGSAISVEILRVELENIGINPIIKGGKQSGVFAGVTGGTDTSVELLISQSELEKATPVITEFKNRQIN